MPRDVEHIVETHRLAAERRAADRPVWDRAVNLADVWRNERMTFEERRDAIVRRLRASLWLIGAGEDSEIVAEVDELAQASDGDEFDEVWDRIYDLADFDRVWIQIR